MVHQVNRVEGLKGMQEEKRGLMLWVHELELIQGHIIIGNIGPWEMWLFYEIIKHCWGKKGVCTRTTQHFCAETGKSKSTIDRALKKLMTLKFIKPIYRYRKNFKIRKTTDWTKVERAQRVRGAKILASHYKIHPRIKSFITTPK